MIAFLSPLALILFALKFQILNELIIIDIDYVISFANGREK